MFTKRLTPLRSANWSRTLNLLLVVALLLPALAMACTGVTTPVAATKAQPRLLQMAAQQPNQTMRVIVQKLVMDDSLEQLVPRLGGRVTRDLHIINAFAVELPAKAVPALARAEGVRWVSLDAPVVKAGKPTQGTTCDHCYLDTTGVQPVWDMGLQGQGIAVAVIDSGISVDADFRHLGPRVSFNSNSNTVNDVYGHGTHVAGIVAGDGSSSNGTYAGIAPEVTLIGLKISDETGMAYESDTVEAMQWVLDNKDMYNIRVVNLSINSTVEQSYHTSPLDAAAEILWFNRIVVVASAGNTGSGGEYNTIDAAPANDPFIITVGASDEKGTTDISDDQITSYSAYGETMDGFYKPDIIAPGQDIISVLAKDSEWDTEHPDRVVNGEYFRISGTSMAAPMVAGAVALLLQDEPNLTPDQVKYRLIHASNTIRASDYQKDYPYLSVYAAVTGTTTESANTGVTASQLLWTGDEPVTWDSVNWDSVNWNSVNWDSVNWDSVNWNSVNWNSVSWDD